MNPWTWFKCWWSRPAMKTPLPASDRFPFTVTVDGEDLVVRNVWATCFGGSADPQDEGETACGYLTRGHPDLLGCALPLDGYGVSSLKGSPLPKMPFGLRRDGTPRPGGAFVTVSMPQTGTVIESLPVIDLGPKGGTGNFIDLSIAAARRFDHRASARNFKMRVDVRILGGAAYL